MTAKAGECKPSREGEPTTTVGVTVAFKIGLDVPLREPETVRDDGPGER